jgi:hypothetical protein
MRGLRKHSFIGDRTGLFQSLSSSLGAIQQPHSLVLRDRMKLTKFRSAHRQSSEAVTDLDR